MALVVLAVCCAAAVVEPLTAGWPAADQRLVENRDELRRLEYRPAVDLSHPVAAERRELVGHLRAVIAERAVAVGAGPGRSNRRAGQLIELAGEGGRAGVLPSAWRSPPSSTRAGTTGVAERELVIPLTVKHQHPMHRWAELVRAVADDVAGACLLRDPAADLGGVGALGAVERTTADQARGRRSARAVRLTVARDGSSPIPETGQQQEGRERDPGVALGVGAATERVRPVGEGSGTSHITTR